VSTRVVSMPCWKTFDALPEGDRNAVLTSGVPTVSVEAGVTLGWSRYADASVGIDRFGASAPGSQALAELGINVDNVVDTANAVLKK